MRRLVLVVGMLSWVSVVHAQEAPRRMSLSDCVTTALRNNADVRTARDDEAIAKAQLSETIGQTLPRIHTDLALQEYTSSFNVAFGPFPPFPLHAPTVWSFSVAAIQPLTALVPLIDQAHLRDLGVDIAAIRRESMRRDVAFRVIEAYYRLLESERLAEVAVQSVDQLEGQVKQANSFHDAGVVSRSDVLRADLALASAKQRVIQQRAQVALGRARLATAMGIAPQTPVEPEPLSNEPDTRAGRVSIEQAEQTAERVELRELDRRIDQSKVGVRIAWYKLGPQVNLVANYTHNDQGVALQLFEKDSFWIGGTLSWDVWDWGTNIAGIHEADARLRQARTARDKMRDQLDLEVREAFLNVGTAAEGTVVAKAAVASAEENFRLVNKRYDANTATSFDVVDAENLLTQARAQLYTSTYDYLVARAALRRATGDGPDAQLKP
jgi:outer membrane protein